MDRHEERAINAMGRQNPRFLLYREQDPTFRQCEVAWLAEQFREVEKEALDSLREQIVAEAREVKLGEAFYGGSLHGASVYNVMMWSANRIADAATKDISQ
jgi:hypothetical protein